MRLDTHINNFYEVLLKYPWRVVALVLLVAFVVMSGARFLEFSTDYRIFFGGNDIRIHEFDKQQKMYAKNDSVLIAIEPTANDVFNYDLLKAIKRFTHEAWRLPHVTRVDSLTNFQDSFAANNEMVIQDLVGDGVDFGEALLRYVKKVALSEPVLVNRLVSEDGKYTGIALTVHLPDGNEKNTEIVNIVTAVRELAERLKQEPSVENVYLSGTVMINNAFYEVSKQDLMTLIPIMFLMIIIFMVFMIRSFGATMVVFSLVGLAVGITFGIGAFLGVQLTPPSASAAPIIMMLSIAGCVHVLTAYYKGYRLKEDKKEAMLYSLRANFVPVTLTSITTVIGFLTMNFSESPPFHDLGNLVAIGTIAAYLLTMLFLPLVVVKLPVVVLPKQSRVEYALGHLAEWVLNNRRTLVLGTFFMALFLVLFISRNSLNDEFVKYFDESITFRTDNDFITQNLTGIYQIEYSLSAGKADNISDPEYLSAVESFANWYRQQKNVMHVQTVVDVYKKANLNLHDGKVEYYRVPQSKDLAAQALLAYEMSLPFGLDLNDQINVDKSAAKFVVSLETISADELLALESKAEQWLADNAPSYMAEAIGTGPAVLFSHIGMRSIKSGLLGGVAALILICALLSLVFRSFKIGLISMVPNLFPAAMAFGVWGIVNGQINMALATVLSMTLGIIVDDTIHFISKYRKCVIEGATPEDAVRDAFTNVGVAIVVTTIVLVAGFAVLMFSPFVMNWGMGLLSSITITFALLIDLILLPAFLVHFGKNTDEIPILDGARA